jgi:hypothetical protein
MSLSIERLLILDNSLPHLGHVYATFALTWGFAADMVLILLHKDIAIRYHRAKIDINFYNYTLK